MRDLLTAVAGLLILVLAALLAVPPFIDWPAHRGLVEAAIARALGQEVRTAGPLDIRLLPSPRIRMQRLRIGSDDPAEASLDARYVRAEIALTPLLGGEVRFLDTRIGRAEFKLPTGAGGEWRVPRRLFAGVEQRRAWAFEDLEVQQFLLTTTDPATGRTDQAYAENVRVQAPSFAGPWRLDGRAGTLPFELSLGEFAPDLSASLKLRGGGGTAGPRFDLDGRLDFAAGNGEAAALIPRFAGTGRLVASPPAAPAPGESRLGFQAQASLKAAGRSVELDGVSVEIGEGTGAVRLAGSGSYQVDDPRLVLTLAGRRADAAAFAAAYGADLPAGLAALRQALAGLPAELSLRLDSLAVGGDEEIQNLALRAGLEADRIRIDGLELAGPGRSALRFEGEFVDAGDAAGGSGRLDLQAQDSDRFGRFVRSLPGPPGFAAASGLLDGPPFRLSFDLTLSDPVLSLRNLRAALGDAAATGTVRYTRAERGARARLDGQLALSGLDVARLPDGGAVMAAARDLDLGLTLDARDVAYRSERGGRIAGRLMTDGPAVVVEGLEVSGLAGSQASLSGRIAPDGGGRIEGRLTARQAAPLVELFGRAWLGGLARLLPDVVRQQPLDLGVTAERVGGTAEPTLRTRIEGELAGGPVRAETLSSGGLVREFTARLSTGRDTLWLGGAEPRGAAAPAELDLSGRRSEDGRLRLEARGELGGMRAETVEPLRLGAADDRVESGAADLRADDASRLLAALGIAAPGPVPLRLRASAASADRLAVRLSGRIADQEVEADLSGRSVGEIEGRVKLERVSLPWLASALALNLPPPGAGAEWSSARFGSPVQLPVAGSVSVEAALLEGPGGLKGRDARFGLATRPDGFALSGLEVAFGEGRLRGGFTLGRQGGLAALTGEVAAEDVALSGLIGLPFGPGRLSGSLRFGASGESAAGLVGALGGAGEIGLDGFAVAGADPVAIGRVATRVLATDDPLASARWQALLAEELGRGPFAPDGARASVSLVAGAVRITPLRLRGQAGSWQGSAVLDLRTRTLEARGLLETAALPRAWIGEAPMIGLGWSGPFARPVRIIDPAPLVNGLAAVVLSRELDRVETFERDAAERQRHQARQEMDRQRRLAAEETARQARLRQEAEERVRQEAERERQEAERRHELERRDLERRRQQELDRRAPAPVDIRPPVQGGG
ncbi:AsmA family protein [Enterovirga sp.]|uniref:AsmA family protein n=1 Tax=Enterovirga sp. TaxID=2026350 RepID=UPI002635C9F4|nr:AsmA family protein [Enterovirga sp.]MDB5591874.1 hypothetical protein [Enterovirga sp.]